MTHFAYFLFISTLIFGVQASGKSCDHFLDYSELRSDSVAIGRSIRYLNSQDVIPNERSKWNHVWRAIPKDDYIKKIDDLESLNPAAYLRFQERRALPSYSIKLEPERINEWLKIDSSLRKLARTEVDISLDLIRSVNRSLTTFDSTLNRHGRFRKYSYRDDFFRFAPDFEAYLAVDVETGMRDLLQWYHLNKSIVHPIELATIFYQRFVTIHPFMDGNGRTGALLVGFILLKKGYPPPMHSNIESAIMMRSIDLEKDVTVSDALGKMTKAITASINALNF